MKKLLAICAMVIIVTPATATADPAELGCYQPAEGPSAADGLQLDASLTSTDSGWLVQYTVANVGNVPRYVVTEIPELFVPRYEPENYYLTPRSDGSVEIAKRDFWRVDTCELPTYAVPPASSDVRQLDPGQSFAEEFVVTSPMEVKNPFGRFVVHQMPPMPASPATARFCLGYMTEMNLRNDRPWFNNPEDQKFLCAGPFDL